MSDIRIEFQRCAIPWELFVFWRKNKKNPEPTKYLNILKLSPSEDRNSRLFQGTSFWSHHNRYPSVGMARYSTRNTMKLPQQILTMDGVYINMFILSIMGCIKKNITSFFRIPSAMIHHYSALKRLVVSRLHPLGKSHPWPEWLGNPLRTGNHCPLELGRFLDWRNPKRSKSKRAMVNGQRLFRLG